MLVLLGLVVFSLWVGVAAAQALPSSYQLLDLGPLTTPFVGTAGGGTAAGPYFISANSDLVFDSQSGKMWDFSSGTPVLTQFAVPAGFVADAMNDSGTVVGSVPGPNSTTIAGTWAAGTFTPMPTATETVPVRSSGQTETLTMHASNTTLLDIDDAGDLVGFSAVGDADCHSSIMGGACGGDFAVEASGGAGPAVLGRVPDQDIDGPDCEFDQFYADFAFAIDAAGRVFGRVCWMNSAADVPVTLNGVSTPVLMAGQPPIGASRVNPADPDAQQVNGLGHMLLQESFYNGQTTVSAPMNLKALNDSDISVEATPASIDGGPLQAVMWSPSATVDVPIEVPASLSTNLQDISLGPIDNADDLVATDYPAGGGSQGPLHLVLAVPAKPSGAVTISSGNAVPEPQGGTEPATFTITLPGPQSSDTTVDYETTDGTATTAANDYTAVPNGSVTIPAGDPSAQVDVQVDSGSGQSTTQTKSFQVQLTGSSGPPISSTGAVADGTITLPGIGGTLTDAAGQEQAGIQVTLTGTADTGQAVVQQTTSNGLGRYQFYTDPGTYALTLAPPPGGNGSTDFEPAPLSCPGGGRPGGCDDIPLGEGNATIDFRVLTLEVASVDPASGSPVGGNEMMIVGSGFGPAGSGVSVVFCAVGGSCADHNAVVLSDSLITLKIPEESNDIAAADGRATVEVQEPTDNGTPWISNQVPFNYKLRVESIDPKRVSPAGGDEVVVKGTGFGPAGTPDQVHLFPAHGDGVEARHVEVLSDDRIQVKIPEEDRSFTHNDGKGTLTVAVPILNDVVVSDRTDFRYDVKLDSIAPKSASATGGKEMAIKGSGFGPRGTADRVVFCTTHARCVPADDVKVLNDDRITAKIPREEKHRAHADGSETVSVVVPIAGKKDVVDSNRVRFKYHS